MTRRAGRKTDPAAQRLLAIESGERPRLRLATALILAGGLLVPVQSAIAAYGLGRVALDPALDAPILGLVLAFALAGLLRMALDLYGGRLAFLAAQSAIDRLRNRRVATALLTSPFASGQLSSAAHAALIGEKLDLLAPYFSRYWPARRKVMLLPFVILAVTAWYSWAVALILLVAGPLIPLFMALIGISARNLSEKQLAETASINALLLERLNALADIRLLDGRATMLSQFAASAEALRLRTMAVLRIAFLSSTVLELFSALGVALVAVYVGFSLLGVFSFGSWGTPLGLSEGLLLLLLAPEFFNPLRELAAGWHDRASALAVAGEIDAEEKRDPLRILGRGAVAESLAGPLSLETRDLVAELPGTAAIAYPDFVIRTGETVAVSGPSGVGKSLLLSLLAGLIPPRSGSILVHGALLDDSNADRWRAEIAWIPQRPKFRSASIRANLCGSAQPLDHERLDRALALAGLQEVIARLPRGLDTRLGESGSQLSGGEARRLMIARALYADATLILADEPTADLDADNAARVADALLGLSNGGRTLIVATHDQDLVGRMDRVIALGGQP
ncbi:thiol reductant ABC exporter subunit CydD [Rhizobium alvei]|uniref:Thiol reductant ABC exporter subunit CydD n=1 Tax=Rhizobium alvei TaxID=1132659 RepID=A0ABT8YH47_9HYPH|nr:thiol reductant ABC exporter subunit CydD [Rhizobium alvei]MDO6962901.1 thiol reductant ABC exporter subunit CydD [Rhizobium alvei]